jgi:oxygen-dependent protoporphyrinogen oxidase
MATSDPSAPCDVLVIGGGVSGLAIGHLAARSGCSVTVLEASPRLGGCLDTRTSADGFWQELGAHTCYNSYTALISLLEHSGGLGHIVPRGKARTRFGRLAAGQLQVCTPLTVFGQFRLGELLLSLPRALVACKADASMREHFSRWVGPGNYDRVLGPFLAAVPSQAADAFPASGPGSLFKRRTRRRDVTKSWTLQQGLGSIARQLAQTPGLQVHCEAAVASVAQVDGRWQVQTADGRSWQAGRLAVAVPPDAAAGLLQETRPALSALLGQIAMASVDSVGVVLDRDATRLPELAFVVPVDDVFFSAVTRDPLPDARRRAFTFHFRPGLDAAAQLSRICAVLGCREADLQDIHRRHSHLPSPRVGHGAVVAALDAQLTGDTLALCGNYFQGLAIEDCVGRAMDEWRRWNPPQLHLASP